MGCIFSCFKNNNRGVETLLLTTDYCYICNQRLINNQNEYFKINGEL